MIRLILNSQKGQTAVEYVLMLAVGASIGLTAFKKLNEYLLSRPDSVIGKPLNELKTRMSQDQRYRRAPFAVRK
jgi:Flp pilus assembly pilin Flp